MICRISDSNDGDDGYYGLDEYGHPVHDELPLEDDDSRQWGCVTQEEERPISLLYRQIDILKKLYKGE